jgi:DNA-binding NtrC family response regulator
MAIILVVDDELGIRALLSEILTDEGHTVEVAENAAEARSCRERLRPDLKEWGATGLLTMPVIMMSGHGTIDTAVEATKFGAMAFLEKPVTLQKLLRAVEQGLSKPVGNHRAAAAPSVHHNHHLPDTTLTVEAAMTGGAMLPTTPLMLGPQSEQSFDLDRPLREARDAFEKSYFEFHLAQENGSMTRVAEKTGLERTHLYRKLKQLGVDLSRNKRGGVL